MKIILPLIFLYLCSPLIADEHVTVFQDASVPTDSQLVIRQNIQAIGGDTNVVAYADNPMWRLKSDTNIVGHVDCVRIDDYGINGFKNMTLSQYEAQITKDVRPPDKQKIKVQSISDLKIDYELIPSE